MVMGFRWAQELLYQVEPPLVPSESLREQVAPLHVQPVPLIEAKVRPFGSVSATVTVPEVGPLPELFTDTVYTAPIWPCVKLPACVEETVSTGETWMMTVLSVADAPAEPPPDTLTELTWGEAAFGVTLTVTVIGG